MPYDDRSLKETMQDADAKLRTANALNLAQIGLQGAQVRLQADALSEQRETNRRLEELGVTQAQLVALDRSIDANIREGSRTLGELKNAADRMGGLLSEQNGLLAGIGGELHGMRVEQAYQNFAMWRQTPEGVRYMEWAKRAQDTVDLILRRTQRMEGARERDMRDNAHRLLADRVEKRGEAPSKPLKPAFPKRPPMPERPVMKVAGVAERRFILAAVTTIIGFLYMGIQGFIGCLHGGFIYALFGFPIPAILGGLAGLAIGIVLGLIVFHKTERIEREESRYESRMAEYTEAKRRNEDYERNVNAINVRYEHELERWRTAMAEWEHPNMDSIPREARALTVQPTRWAVSNPMDVVRTLTGIMEQAPFRPPVVDMLPDPVPPALAAPESIPDTAPMMRAELEAIRLEEETFSPTSSESAKPDPWAVRD